MKPSTISDLPGEVIKIVFGHIQQNDDIKNCRLVCTSWELIISSIYWKDGVCIPLEENKCKLLKKDIEIFPGLATKIRQIKLTWKIFGIIKAKEPCVASFRSIVNMCPNLNKIQFPPTEQSFNYMESLDCREVYMPSIQTITLLKMKHLSPAIRSHHLRVNYYHRSTITSLEIWDLGTSRVLNQHGGLNPFISRFCKLKCLKLRSYGKDIILDLVPLINSCTSELETLDMSDGFRGTAIILIADRKLNQTLQTTSCNSLTRLKLNVLRIHANTLEYIMLQFNNNLNLIVTPFDKVHKYKNFLFGESDMESIIDRFATYCNGIARVDVILNYVVNQEDANFTMKVENNTLGGAFTDDLYSNSDEDSAEDFCEYYIAYYNGFDFGEGQ